MALAPGLLGGLCRAGGDAGQCGCVVESGAVPHHRVHLRSDRGRTADPRAWEKDRWARESFSFCLPAFSAYLTSLHPSFAAAGFTAAIILVFGGQGEPWHMAWLRVLYTMLGAVIAFGVGALIWPVHARVGLREKLASILEGAGELYRAVTAAALQGIDNEQQVRQLDRQLHDLRRGITQQMDEAKSELAFSRFNEGAYQAFVDCGRPSAATADRNGGR